MNSLYDCLMYIIVIVLGVSIGLTLYFAVEFSMCKQFGQQVEHPVIYRIPSGCFVQVNEQWIPKKNFYVIK